MSTKSKVLKLSIFIGLTSLVVYLFILYTEYKTEQEVNRQLDGVSPLVCLPQPRDATPNFGRAIAAAGNYIVVGDQSANAVWVYERDANNSWEASKLSPPADSEFAKREKGFGHDVDINDSGAIVIGAQIREALGVAPRREPGDGFLRFSGVYTTDTASELVKEIDDLNGLQDEYIYGHNVTRSNEYVGVGLRVIKGDDYGVSRVLVANLNDATQEVINVPSQSTIAGSNSSLASHDTHLLAGTQNSTSTSGVIVDLDTGTQAVIPTIGTTSAYTGFAVDIVDGNAVMGGSGGIVIATEEQGAWVAEDLIPVDNDVVAISRKYAGMLPRESARIVSAGVSHAIPPLDLTLVDLETGDSFTNRLAPLETKKIYRYPTRSLAMTDDFAVIAQPYSADCKVAVTYFEKIE
jgi:hypothetical protein